MRGRDRQHFAQTQFVELGDLDAFAHAFGLVGHQQAGLAHATQVFGDVMVLGRQAATGIDLIIDKFPASLREGVKRGGSVIAALMMGAIASIKPSINRCSII